MTKKSPRGYIALMATIIMSLTLLAMITDASFSGWFIRYSVLGTQDKEQSVSLAEGCIALAQARVASMAHYAGDVTEHISLGGTEEGTCYIAAPAYDTPLAGEITIATQAQVGKAFTVFNSIEKVSTGEVLSRTEVPHL